MLWVCAIVIIHHMKKGRDSGTINIKNILNKKMMLGIQSDAIIMEIALDFKKFAFAYLGTLKLFKKGFIYRCFYRFK